MRNTWLISLGLLSVLMFQIASAASNKLQAARRSYSSAGTRLVFEFSQPPKFTYFALDKPRRLVVDLPKTQLSAGLTDSVLRRQIGLSIHSGIRQQQDLRLVLSLPNPQPSQVFVLPANASNPHARLVVDFPIHLDQSLQAAATAKVLPSAEPKPVLRLPWESHALRDVIIVIDPGHGGKDPGAAGDRGSYEKDVVLAISKELQQLINKQSGMQAFLTRSRDRFLTLRERLHRAREANADIFIAIHADAFPDSRANGSSVYALSQRGATSEAARWLAEKENYSELGGVDLNNKSNLLRSVLLDLSQTATIDSSLQLGTYMLGGLRQVTRLHRKRVEQAPFVVLKSPDIPSILIEIGFISNPMEEQRLKNHAYQQRLAQAMLNGLNDYFSASAPPDSWLAKHRRARHHVVTRGQTLSSVAARYNVSMAGLRHANKLLRNELMEGQVLVIPN
jgi:N-acetylmuramoyl-L-alanine amidase